MRGSHSLLLSAALLVAFGIPAREAAAFCGFYVGGADATLYNNATMVVLMREGTRTVLSMQNNYQGPPERFAMVVPVPIVLQKENVKTLPREIFARVDRLAAPRLVEYWEQDPCPPPAPPPMPMRAMKPSAKGAAAPMADAAAPLGVKIEAQFTVAEYEIVILSAQDSMGLDTWLRREGYTIPKGAEPYRRPYVQQGMKFFVAKVDPKKVTFDKGQAMLSPLRFHYDTETFALPVRLGLMNSAGTQDLIVHVLAKQTRYEVANFDNVSIPTNLDVADDVRRRFGEFYAALFDKTLEKNPGAVVTEYSWDASSCDPCPTPPLSPGDLMTLGADALPEAGTVPPPVAGGPPVGPPPVPMPMPGPRRWGGSGCVVTRLHARYRKDALADDLVFRAAAPIVGGREFVRGEGGKLEEGAQSDRINNFQARYAIRHPWTGPIACKNPRRGVWGGPPAGVAGDTRPTPATDLAFAPRGQVALGALLPKGGEDAALRTSVLLAKGTPLPKLPEPAPAQPVEPGGAPKPASRLELPPGEGGCAGCRIGSGGTTELAALALASALAALVARRRRR